MESEICNKYYGFQSCHRVENEFLLWFTIFLECPYTLIHLKKKNVLSAFSMELIFGLHCYNL